MLNATCGKSTLGKVYYYERHRSNLDKFESKCKLRTPKLSGSIKINGACPSRIRKQTYIGSSRVSVTFTSTHYGHQLELKCQPLSATEKTTIINQIKGGVSQDHIIEKAREINEEGEWSRLNLLTKKDLYYIADKNKLNNRRHKSDLVAVDLKVAEWNSGDRKNVMLRNKPLRRPGTTPTILVCTSQMTHCRQLRPQKSLEAEVANGRSREVYSRDPK